MRYDEFGRELPDDTPVALPVNFKKPPSLHDRIRAAIRQEMSQQAAEAGHESFEEADDFDVDEEPEPLSQYELHDMQLEAIVPKDRDQAAIDVPAKQDVEPSPAVPEAAAADKAAA